jgi:hypothetical protein
MAKENSIKRWLYYLKKDIQKSSSGLLRKIKRLLSKRQEITPQNCFEIPIIINNRNRYTFLKLMIEQLRNFGYKNIYVLDNDSSYPPLLEYYKTFPAEVIYLKQNIGYKALWKSHVFKRFESSYYVYTDPDILLQEDCPRDFIYHLYKYLNKYPSKEKAGVALQINDLPDSYSHKQIAIKNEKVFWTKELEPNVYDALVDTTLALYKPFASGDAEECPAIRVAGKLTAKHLTWYLDSSNLSQEELYYKSSIKQNTSVYSVK